MDSCVVLTADRSTLSQRELDGLLHLPARRCHVVLQPLIHTVWCNKQPHPLHCIRYSVSP